MASKQPNTHIPRTMIALNQPGANFSLRTAAVAIHDGYVLLHRSEQDDFWSLPGGRCELLETAQDAIQREMREELGAEARVERLLWVLENFFCYDGVACHELGLYFLIDLGPAFAHYDPDVPFEGTEESLRLVFRWFALDALQNVRLYPTFLRDALQDLPDHVEHVVHHDAE
jgi:ADP-ribose pyrophosphatase YjhB (NUDIX family)